MRALPKLAINVDAKDLCQLSCRVRTCVDTIKSLNQYEYLASPELANSIIGKLTHLLRTRWQDFASEAASSSERPVYILELLSKFLTCEADRTVRFGYIADYSSDLHGVNHRDVKRNDSNVKSERHSTKVYAVSTATARTASKSDDPKSSLCSFCSASQHCIKDCQGFRNLSVDDRWRWVNENKVCRKCLRRGGHSYRNCQTSCKVQHCKVKRSHNTLLHGHAETAAHVTVAESEPQTELFSSSPSPPEGGEPNVEITYSVDVEVNAKPVLSTSVAHCDPGSHNPSVSQRPLLKVVPVTVNGPKGSVDTLALLDDGSSATFVDSDIAAIIGATGSKSQVNIRCVGGLTKQTDVEYVNFGIRGRTSDKPFHEIRRARSIPNLGVARQTLHASDLRHDHLSGLDGLLCYEMGQPKIIVGADNWHLTVPLEVRRGTRSQPVACRTSLGWVIFGFSTSKSAAVKFSDQNIFHISEEEERVDVLLKEHLRLESLGIEKKDYFTPDDERAIKMVTELTRRLPSGRFETCLPWKDDIMSVPKSYPLALNRFLNLEKKFQRNKQYADVYKANIHAMIDKEYAELCREPPSESGLAWYLPHFGVIHPQKRKLRVVHDAAACVQGVCLNSLLLTGPDLLQPLLAILMRFREGQIALNGDIREMFPQTKIRAKDRDAQRFLWRGDPSEPIREYRMASMMFGASSSPFIAQYLKNRNAAEHKLAFPEAAEAIIKDHYMDDFLGSVDSVDDAARLASDIVKVHSMACLEMSSWVSNNKEALALLPAELCASNVTQVGLTAPQALNVKVLGVAWNVGEDSLGFRSLPSPFPVKWTKRCVLSQLMRVYDPLGLLTPVTIRGRIIFQHTWKLGIEWDKALPSSEITKWESWFRELSEVALRSVPRCYLSQPNPIDWQLHLFADASESAFCCVAYWRVTHSDGRVELALIGGKARLAPLKPASIPRLELQAALIATRFATYILEAHRCKASKTTFWTDSLTVLKWLRSDARTFKAFVAHRVGEIAESTDISNWRYVPTALNVADDATRVSSKYEVKRWFSGPPFLLLPPSEWPKEPSQSVNSSNLGCGELKLKQELVGLTTDFPPGFTSPLVADPSHFSDWIRLVRSTARIRLCANTFLSLIGKRHVSNPQLPNSPRSLVAADIIEAEQDLFRQSQIDSFASEIDFVRKSESLPKGSRLKNVSLNVDERGLLRLSSRVLAVRDTSPTRDLQPVVLDGRHTIVRLLLAHIHRKLAHGGIESVVNEMRVKFYTLHLRPSVKNVISRCLACRIRKGTPGVPSFGDLPPARLAHHVRPFSFVGVDYFGPVSVTIGRRHEKRYVALFTCLTVRAVHLELVASLSTDSALMALRRLIARRGCPSDMYSDNGTAFVGAARKLSELYEFAANNKITWHFIPPAAPFMGGCWERLVRSIKVALSATLKERAPKEEVLLTLLLEAEATVNSRPLTHVAVGPDDEEALTPFHFLLGGPVNDRPIRALSDADLCRREDYRKGLRLADHFWARWTREVLPCLVARRPAEGAHHEFRCGDVVIVVDGGLPRASWPRGRVVKIFPGPDGRVRTVEVSTRGGVLKRATRLLVPLASVCSPP